MMLAAVVIGLSGLMSAGLGYGLTAQGEHKRQDAIAAFRRRHGSVVRFPPLEAPDLYELTILERWGRSVSFASVVLLNVAALLGVAAAVRLVFAL